MAALSENGSGSLNGRPDCRAAIAIVMLLLSACAPTAPLRSSPSPTPDLSLGLDPTRDCYDPVRQHKQPALRLELTPCPIGLVAVVAGQSLSALKEMHPPPTPLAGSRQQDAGPSPQRSQDAVAK